MNTPAPNAALAEILARFLDKYQEQQAALNDLSQYLEAKWINDRNPDIQAARSINGKHISKSATVEGYQAVFMSLEGLLMDVASICQSIENRLEKDHHDVSTLSAQVNMLNNRIRSISERSARYKFKSKGKKTTFNTSFLDRFSHDSRMPPLWTPSELIELSSRTQVFHRRALVTRLVTDVYYIDIRTGT